MADAVAPVLSVPTGRAASRPLLVDAGCVWRDANGRTTEQPREYWQAWRWPGGPPPSERVPTDTVRRRSTPDRASGHGTGRLLRP